MRLLFFIGLLLFPASPALAQLEPYSMAQKCYHSLDPDSPSKAWDKCIAQFQSVASEEPRSEYGIKASFSVGRLFQEKYAKTRNPEDLQKAIAGFNQFLREHKEDALADDALFRIGVMRWEDYHDKEKAEKAMSAVLERYPKGDRALEAEQLLNQIRGGSAKPSMPPAEVQTAKPGQKLELKAAPTELTEIRYDNNKTGSTVTLQLSAEPVYHTFVLPADPVAGKPERLVIDIENTRPAEKVGSQKFKDPLIDAVRVALQPDQSTRVVLDTQGVNRHEVERKENRLILKLYPPAQKPAAVFPFRRIVIDPGHGGSDPGAIGPRGTREKEIALQIAKKLAHTLKKDLDCEVFLTRTKDRFVSLEDRTRFADAKKADLFISIHANAADSKTLSGVQTFYLNNASSKAAERLAARENKTAGKDLTDLQKILTTMLQNANTEESRDLALAVQKSLHRELSAKYSGVEDLKVHSALFYVLVGTKVPGILVETSFLTHPQEERRLKDSAYQWDNAEGIAGGLRRFATVQSKMASNL